MIGLFAFLGRLFGGSPARKLCDEGCDLLAERKYAEAEAKLRQAVEAAPEDETSLYNLGLSLHFQRKRQEAAEVLERAVKHAAPVNPAPLIALGMVRYELERFDAARESLQAALRLDCKHPAAHYYLGLILLKEGRVDEATEAFEEVIAERPTFVQARMLALGEGYLNAFRADNGTPAAAGNPGAGPGGTA